MARSLESIIQEIDPGYSGSRSLIQQQQQALPGETTAQLDGLAARAEQAHTNILDAARRRGMGFSGVPIGEQVKYDSTEFKPAVANLYASQNTRKMSLEEALNSLYRDQRNSALGIRESEIAREEQQRQFNENLALQKAQFEESKRQSAQAAAASSAGVGSYFGGGDGGSYGDGGAPKAAQIARTSNGGFKFYDSAGRPINAAQYSQMVGVGYRDLLSQMAKGGDKNAQTALKYVGDDYKFGNAPQAVAGALSALGASGSYAKPSTYVAAPKNNPYATRNWATGKF